MKQVSVPKDALKNGDWIAASDGRIGHVICGGWDIEGSFGYLISTDRSGAMGWAYHHAEAKCARDPQMVKREASS